MYLVKNSDFDRPLKMMVFLIYWYTVVFAMTKPKLSMNNTRQLVTSIKSSKELVMELYHQKHAGEPHSETMMRIIREHQDQKRVIAQLEAKIERYQKKVEGLNEDQTYLEAIAGFERVIQEYKRQLGVKGMDERKIAEQEIIAT